MKSLAEKLWWIDEDGYYRPHRDISLEHFMCEWGLTDNDNIIIVDHYLRECQLRDFYDWHKLINDMRLEDGVLTISLKE